jgi:ABC-type polysaccharide/polyol phosphate export permease
MLNPLLTMVVMTIVFSYFFRFTVERYPVYVLSGMVVWIFFSQSTSQAMHALVWGGGLSNKIFVPKGAFVVSAVFGGLINLFLALAPLALIILVLGQPLSLAVLFLPVSILLVLLFALGVGLIAAALAVLFADVIDIYQFILSVLMYLTPIYYPSSIVPPGFSFFLQLNPIYYFVEIFRLPIYQGLLPEPYILLRAMLISVSTLVVGWWFFTSKSDEFAYRT